MRLLFWALGVLTGLQVVLGFVLIYVHGFGGDVPEELGLAVVTGTCLTGVLTAFVAIELND